MRRFPFTAGQVSLHSVVFIVKILRMTYLKDNLPSCERKAAQSNVFRYLETSVTYFFVLFVRKRLFSENRLYLSKINDFCYSQRLLGPSGGTFGRSWGSLGRSWAALGRSWPPLARLWPLLGLS